MITLLSLFLLSSTQPAAAAVNWREELPPALEAAKTKNDLVLLDFSAPWCHSCHFMDQHVLAEPELDAFASKIEFVRLDVDSADGAKLRQQYFAMGLPNYVIVNPDGEEVGRIVGEQNKDVFFSQLHDILERNSPLSRLEARANGGGGPHALKAAVQVMHAYAQRRTTKEGLAFYDRLSPEMKKNLAADPAGRQELLRLKLLSAYQAKDIERCEKFGRPLLTGRDDCALMYDAYYFELCFEKASAAQRTKGFALVREPLEALLAKGVFGKPAERCPDLQSPAEIGVDTYEALGEKSKADRLLSRLIEQMKSELDGDVGRDRNKADNLLEFLSLAKKDDEIAALYPRLISAYPQTYVYPYLYGRFLLEKGETAKALEVLDGAKKLAYGAGVLRVANARATALSKLGKKSDALAELDAVLKDNPTSFPKEVAALQKTRGEIGK